MDKTTLFSDFFSDIASQIYPNDFLTRKAWRSSNFRDFGDNTVRPLYSVHCFLFAMSNLS